MIESLTEDARNEILGQLPPLITVWACRQCNSILGNRYFRTIRDRRAAVKDSLRAKYHHLLESPDWTESELDEMGYALRSFIAGRMALKKQIRERLRWRP